MFPPRRTPFVSAIVAFLVSALMLSAAAFAQKVTVGVLTGASLTDDFRPRSYTYIGGATRNVLNASKWFMVGPTIELALPKNLAVEFDAIRRRIRSTSSLELPEPVEITPGVTLSR